ncbi:MAG: hypothetical protein JWM20_243 [Patescibacteria group bacterium]|nr:hypothetical protein [Patescibacteria group bacterium]
MVMTATSRIPLHKLLEKCAIKNAKGYSNLKFTGGRNKVGDEYVGWAPPIFYDGKILSIVTPYKRDDAKQEDKPDDEGRMEVLLREALEETGIHINTEELFDICEWNVPGSQDNPDHRQTFYGNRIDVSLIPRMISFPGKNKNDSEKGRPINPEFKEIIQYLPNNHLKVSRILMEKIINDDSGLLLKNTPDEADGRYLAYAREVIEMIDAETEYREEMKKKKKK